MRAVADAAPADALAVVDELTTRGHELRNFCRDLLSHLRDLLVAKAAGDTTALLDSSAASRAELARQANAFSESDLVRFFHSLTETENNLRTAAHPRYQLEIGLVKLMEMRRVVSLNHLAERLAALEESLRTGKAPASVGTPPAPAGGGGGAQGTGGKSVASIVPPRTRASGGSRAQGASEAADASAYAAHSETAPAASSMNLPPESASAPPALTLVPPPGPQAGDAIEAAATTTTRAGAATGVAPERMDSIGPRVPVGSASATEGKTIEAIKVELEKRRRMFLVIALEGARQTLIEADELYVEYAPEAKHLRDNLAKPESVKLLREVCRAVTGRDLGVRIVVKELGAETDGQSSAQEQERIEKQRLREYAEQHPFTQQLLSKFHGEIVDVKRIDGKQNPESGVRSSE
jgi:DNA polymerase-3 subunit gamma/tau